MTMISPERVAQVFVEVAFTLVDEFDLIEFLQKVTTHSSELIDARDAGLLLGDPEGRLQLLAASDERAERIEVFQVQALEGPCQDCFASGTAIINLDLAEADQRWPRFAPKAVSLGYRSVHAFPMRVHGEVLGALNLFGDAPGRISESEAAVIQGLADIATIGLLQQRTIKRGEVLTAQLQAALESRIGIEQAKGALARIHGETPDQSFDRLRAYCRSNHLRLSEVARHVTADPDRVRDLTTPT